MFKKVVLRIIVALILISIAVVPIGTLYYISLLEQAQYQQTESDILLEELAYGSISEITRMDLEEQISVSGTVISTRVIYEELELENISRLRLLVSAGQSLHVGDLIGYLDGREVRATNAGIIRSINRGSEAYIELWSLDDLAIECYVDEAQLNVLRRSNLDLTDSDENKYTVAMIDEIRVGTDLTRVLLTSETASLIYGKKITDLTFNTGRVYSNSLVVDSDCVYSYNGEDHYVRLVDMHGVVLDEIEVEIGVTMGGYTCIINGAQDGQLCDSGFKAIAEGGY